MHRYVVCFDGLTNPQRALVTQAIRTRGIKHYAFPVQSACFFASTRQLDLNALGNFLLGLVPRRIAIFELRSSAQLLWLQGDDNELDDWMRDFARTEPPPV